MALVGRVSDMSDKMQTYDGHCPRRLVYHGNSKQQVNYCTDKRQPMDPIYSQLNPIPNLTYYLFKMYFHITLLSAPRF